MCCLWAAEVSTLSVEMSRCIMCMCVRRCIVLRVVRTTLVKCAPRPDVQRCMACLCDLSFTNESQNCVCVCVCVCVWGGGSKNRYDTPSPASHKIVRRLECAPALAPLLTDMFQKDLSWVYLYVSLHTSPPRHDVHVGAVPPARLT